MTKYQATGLPGSSGSLPLPPTGNKASGSNTVTYAAAAIICFVVACIVFIVAKPEERTGPPQSGQEMAQGSAMPQGHPDTAMTAVIAQLIAVEDSLRTVEKQHPDDPEVHLRLANTLYDLAEMTQSPEHFPESLEYYRKYLAVRPDDAGARTDMAYVLFQNGQQEEAVAELKRVQAANPKHQQSAFNLAMLYKEMQQPDKAIAQLRKVLEMNPRHQQAAFNLVLLYKDQNKPDSVLAYLQLTADIDPTTEVGHTAADALEAYKQSH